MPSGPGLIKIPPWTIRTGLEKESGEVERTDPVTGRPMSASQTFAKRTGTAMNVVYANGGTPCNLDVYKSLVKANRVEEPTPTLITGQPIGIWASDTAFMKSRPSSAVPWMKSYCAAVVGAQPAHCPPPAPPSHMHARGIQ